MLRGPSALLFGSSAIGGVVNVIDTRIPRRVPENAVGVDALAGYGTAANERSLNGARRRSARRPFRRPRRRQLVEERRPADRRPYPVEGSARAGARQPRSGDPGARRPQGRPAQLGRRDRRKARSASPMSTAASMSACRSPGTTPRTRCRSAIRSTRPSRRKRRPSTSEQTRYDARAEIPLGGFFSQVRARGGYANYHHDEIEDTGEIGSSFFSKGGEGRVELVQTRALGLGRHQRRPISRPQRPDPRRGEVPARQPAAAGRPVHAADLVSGPLRFEGGARVEFSKLDCRSRRAARHARRSRATSRPSPARSAASMNSRPAGAPACRCRAARARRRSTNCSPTARTAAASRSRSAIPTSTPKSSIGVEASLHARAGPVHLTGNLYYSHFSNFIFQAPTGEIEDDLPVFQYRQGKANYLRLRGAGATRSSARRSASTGAASCQADAVHATVKNFGPAPLIPPLRVLGGAHRRARAVRRPAGGRARLRAQPHRADRDRHAGLYAGQCLARLAPARREARSSRCRWPRNNIFDVDARRSTSLLKDFAPLAGRDIRLTARLGF